MENDCLYVNSRGILKSCDFHSPNPASSSRDDVEYLNNMLENMFDGMSIYVCSETLIFFVKDTLPKINKNFTLVSGDSDLCVPGEALCESEYNELINSPYLIKWFAQNTNLNNHSKIFQLPIGLDYHTISNSPEHCWKLPEELHLPKDQEQILTNIKQNSLPFYERTNKIYVNFTNQNDRYGQRRSSLKIIPKELLEINTDFVPRTNNWKKTSTYSFVLSPFGNGMDCHRTWEVLCLGCIPIVKAPFFSQLFEDLPVLIINEWTDVTRELLDETIHNFKKTPFNYEKLKLKYWTKKLKELHF